MTCLLVGAVALAAVACGDPETETAAPNVDVAESATTTSELVSSGGEDISEDTAAPDPLDETDETESPTATETSDQLAEPATCDTAPTAIHYVDVDLDDPDGGLNVRTGPGVDNDVIQTLPRANWVQPSGACRVVGSTDWWEIDTLLWGETGWVAARFLTTDRSVILADGVIDETLLVGVTFSSHDELKALINEAYREEPDHVLDVVQVGEAVGLDAQGYEVTFDVLGFRDDAVQGLRITYNVATDPSNPDAADEVLSARSQALCRRGQMHSGCA